MYFCQKHNIYTYITATYFWYLSVAIIRPYARTIKIRLFIKNVVDEILALQKILHICLSQHGKFTCYIK